MITVLSQDFSLMDSWLNELRNIETQKNRSIFRRNMEKIGEIAAYEISKKLQFKNVEIQTPLETTIVKEIAVQPVVITILRAGIPLFNGILNYFDKADAGFVAAYRKHDEKLEFTIQQDYVTCPNIENRPLIVADPMLATGSSLIEALKALQKNGNPSEIHLVAAIAAPEGVENLSKEFPDIQIWVGALDRGLTTNKYIIPGLGDAGDLSFGEKMQQ